MTDFTTTRSSASLIARSAASARSSVVMAASSEPHRDAEDEVMGVERRLRGGRAAEGRDVEGGGHVREAVLEEAEDLHRVAGVEAVRDARPQVQADVRAGIRRLLEADA